MKRLVVIKKWNVIAAGCLAAFLLSAFTLPAQTNDAVKEEPSSVMKAGRAALEDKLYELAQSQFEQYLKGAAAGRDAEDAAILLMRALHEQGKNREIIELYKNRKRFMAKPGAEDAFTFWNAFALYELGKYDEAFKEISDFSRTYPASPYSWRVLRLTAWSYLKTGRTNEALQVFSDFDRTSGSTPEAAMNMLEWGKALVSAGKTEQAHDVFSRLVKLPADQVEVQDGCYWYGKLLINESKWIEAVSTLMALSGNVKARDDLRAEALFSAAVGLNAVSKVEEAIDVYRRGIELARSSAIKMKGEFELARYLVDLGRLDQGIPLLKQCIAKTPTNSLAESAQLKIASSLLNHKKFQESVDEYQHYLETFTNVTGQAEAHAGKGWGLTSLARNAEAATAFMKAYGLFSDPAQKEQSLFKAGDAYFANGQFKLALETYERFLKEFPQSKLAANALFQTAESIAKDERLADAEARFKEVSEKYSGSPVAEEALFRIGEIRVSQAKWAESITAFNKVMNIYTNGLLYAQSLHGRAVANYQLLKFDEALQDFDEVTNRFSVSPVFEHSCYMSGMCSYWLGKDERALSVCRDFIRRYPQSQWAPDAMFWVAKYSYNEESYENAEKDFLLFVEKYPKSPFADEALYRAGLAAAKRKEYVRSIELLSRLAKDYPESRKMAEGRFAQAEALTELARFPDAILIFDEVIKKYPASPLVIPAWSRKGDCQFGLGADERKRYEESIESFRVVVNASGTGLDLVMRAEYQIGRCMEKLGRGPDAFQQYYKKVILRYFEDREKGVKHNEACKQWFMRAGLNAADLMENKKDWRGTVSILERLVNAGVPGVDEIRKRISKIKSEHWWLFYKD